jgi:stringent starvation protein B
MSDVKRLIQEHLDKGTILILVDSCVEGVSLPKHLMNSIQVRLNLSRAFKTNIFKMDDEKVIVDLGFNGERVVCVLPYKAIYYIATADDPLNGFGISENTPIELLELSESLEQEESARKTKDQQATHIKQKDVEEKVNKALADRKARARKPKDVRDAEDEMLKNMMKYYNEQDAKKKSSSTPKKTIPGPNISGPNRSSIGESKKTNYPIKSPMVFHGGKRGKGESEQ